MAKFDEQLSRMSYLMEYKMPKNEVKSNIEYHANGADGKVYGILKEGNKYYIKTTEIGKENLAESYDYINGINNKRENEFKSYNDATKHLEVALMSLNEAYGKHEDVSTVDFKRGEKTMTMLTEAARTELDRMQQIFENSGSIGAPVVGKDSVHGSATDPKKQGDPFGEGSSEGTHEKGTTKTQSDAASANKDYTDVSKSVESKMTSTEMPKGGTAKNDFEKADKPDSEGVNIAGEKKEGGKVVRVNEGIGSELGSTAGSALGQEAGEAVGTAVCPGIGTAIGGMIGGAVGGELGGNAGSSLDSEETDNEGEFEPEENVDVNIPDDSELLYDPEGQTEGDAVGLDDDEEEENYDDMSLDEMLEKFDSVISGDDETMTGPGSDNKGNAIATWERVNEEDETQKAKEGGEAIMDGEPNTANDQGGHKEAIATWERVEEAINREAKRIMNECSKPKKETLQEMVQRLVNEEVTKLNAWGKHPRFRKEPMTTPPNKEVLAGTADRDWNDDSAKGEQPYGLKIGSSAPFDQTVEFLTDGVMTQLKESLGLKKK